MTRLYNGKLVGYSNDETHYVLTEKGRNVLKSMVDVTSISTQLDIFAKVNLQLDLRNAPILTHPGQVGDISDPENPGQVVPLAFDPRFVQQGDADPVGGTEDLRLAVVEYLNVINATGDGSIIDPRPMIFYQHIGSGKYDIHNPNFWQSVRDGSLLEEIDAIIASAYKWTDIGGGDVETSKRRMAGLYKAGMAERIRLAGDTCSTCKVPLGVLEAEQQEYGRSLESCPGCGKKFGAPPAPPVVQEVTEFECPKCGCGIHAGDVRCYGCNAKVDFGMAPGSVKRRTTYRTEVSYKPVVGWRYTHSFGYQPQHRQYHLDPYRNQWEYRRLARVGYLW
jgi:hypothetical protein